MYAENTTDDDDDYEIVYLISPDGEYLCETDEDAEIETLVPGSQAKRKKVKLCGRQGRKPKYGMSREVRKIMYNTNRPYINTKGKEVTPKTFDEQFKCTCKKKCTQVLKMEDRRRLFNEFWSIGSFSERCLLLQQHIKEFPKKRSYTKEVSRRHMSRKYFINNVEVCKVAFLKTLQIHSNRIDVALQKRDQAVITDMRGSKSGGRNKCSKEQIDGVVEHINNYLVYIAQRRKKQSEKKQFQGSELNLKRMYNLYKMACKDVAPVSHSTYKLIFYRQFNRRVKTPQKLLSKSEDMKDIKEMFNDSKSSDIHAVLSSDMEEEILVEEAS